MKNDDLESQLRTLRVPEREEDYWQNFPRQVTVGVRARWLRQDVSQSRWPKFVWSTGLALACYVFSFFIGHTATSHAVSRALLKDAGEFRLMILQFPDRVRALLQNDHGQHTLVEDQ